MFIPDFCLSRIPDPKKQQKGGVKKLFFSSHKYHTIENYFIFELAKKNF
jgi:hypothetical protein